MPSDKDGVNLNLNVALPESSCSSSSPPERDLSCLLVLAHSQYNPSNSPFHIMSRLSFLLQPSLHHILFSFFLPSSLFLPLLPSLGRENSFYSPVFSFLNLFFYTLLDLDSHFLKSRLSIMLLIRYTKIVLIIPSLSLASFLYFPLGYIYCLKNFLAITAFSSGHPAVKCPLTTLPNK